MRFACQSCGKAYNLPEEKIADKSNVKLKCRVCGAIVEVKRQGEVVAQILGDSVLGDHVLGDHVLGDGALGDNVFGDTDNNKRGRVSEAPPASASLSPEDMLTSMSADDSDDATRAIAVGDQVLSEGGSGDDAASALLGHVTSALGQRGHAALSPPSPGFSPTPVPPPLSIPDLPRLDSPRPDSPRSDLPRADPPPPFQRSEPTAPPLPSGFGTHPGSPPPPLPSPLPGSSVSNGSNGAVPRFGDAMPLPDQPPPIAPTTGMSMPAVSGTLQGVPSSALPGIDTGGYAVASLEVSHAPPASGDTTRKILAALATGILIGFIIARLFF
jgi:zinc-ribbon domain